MIPESFIEELKYRSDIEQIVSPYVRLKRSGRNLTGLCPFHSEKSPSFVVYPENQSFIVSGAGPAGISSRLSGRSSTLSMSKRFGFSPKRRG